MPARRRFLPRSQKECRRALGDVRDSSLSAALEAGEVNGEAAFKLLTPPKLGDWLDSREERGQSFPQYEGRMNPKSGGCLPRKACDGLLVCPVGESFALGIGQRVMPFLMDYYAAFFPGMDIEVLEKPLSLRGVSCRENDFGHKQYLIGEIFQLLNTHKDVISKRKAYSRLGITLEDIYPGDDWNYVFGQARPMERVGVFSFARHSPLFYKGVHAAGANEALSPLQLLTWMRFCGKTMVHETCHMFGMLHCIYWNCCMNGNNGPGDSAGASFLCPVCLRKLLHGLTGVLGCPSVDIMDTRYERMRQALLRLANELDPDRSSAALRRDLEWLTARRAQLEEIRAAPPPPEPHAEAWRGLQSRLAARKGPDGPASPPEARRAAAGLEPVPPTSRPSREGRPLRRAGQCVTQPISSADVKPASRLQKALASVGS